MKWALGDGSLAFRAPTKKGEVQGQSCMWEQSREISPSANCPTSCFGDRLAASFPTVDGSGTQRSDLEKITLQTCHRRRLMRREFITALNMCGRGGGVKITLDHCFI